MNNKKQNIINLNNSFGLNTEFFNTKEDILGYSLGNTIYLNEDYDIEKTNKHELLHFFEETDTFKEIKNNILESIKDNLDSIRSEYELRYMGLYSEDEISKGIIDTEIVIDILINNFVFEIEDGLKIGNYTLGRINEELENKRYLNLSIKKNIDNMNLTKWEKLFVTNYYDGKDKIFPPKENRYEKIRRDIDNYLDELINLVNNKENFRIYTSSLDLIREYESEIKALKARGKDTKYLENNKEYALRELSDTISNQLYEEYKHIVNFIMGTNYENAFKALMLRETLTKTYKLDKDKNGKSTTIIGKRELHNTIDSHMILNDSVLKTIYNNIDDYNNFALIYFAGLDLQNKKIIGENNISLDNVDTYGKGKWIKFEGKTSNEEEYLENSKKLASLVKDTPWCTKTLASSQLSEGDFYVFVDNDNNPHIAVKMLGGVIDEVRGILNGNAQELEEEYRDVALSFLDNNKDIKNGKEWLEKEEWNKRLIEYNEKIDNGTIVDSDVENILKDLFEVNDFKSHGGENSNKERLIENLVKIKDKLAKYYDCTEDEIYCGNIEFRDTEYTECPYKVILGDADFSDSKVTNASNLCFILGSANFDRSNIISLDNLRIIGDWASFRNSEVTNLENLKVIEGDAYFRNSKITSLKSLRKIGGCAYCRDSQVRNLENLIMVGKDAYFVGSKVTNLKSLQTIGDYADFRGSKLKRLESLEYIGYSADFSDSDIEDLGSLEKIGGDANFNNSQVRNLGNLKEIEGDAYFNNSQVRNLGNLKEIEGDAYFKNSQVRDLGSLKEIEGDAVFSNSKVENLENLKLIGGKADFENSQVTNLGNLEEIGESADFYYSKVENLENLKTIGGDVDFRCSQIVELKNLRVIKGVAYFDSGSDLEKMYIEQFENGRRKNIDNISMHR